MLRRRLAVVFWIWSFCLIGAGVEAEPLSPDDALRLRLHQELQKERYRGARDLVVLYNESLKREALGGEYRSPIPRRPDVTSGYYAPPRRGPRLSYHDTMDRLSKQMARSEFEWGTVAAKTVQHELEGLVWGIAKKATAGTPLGRVVLEPGAELARQAFLELERVHSAHEEAKRRVPSTRAMNDFFGALDEQMTRDPVLAEAVEHVLAYRYQIHLDEDHAEFLGPDFKPVGVEKDALVAAVGQRTLDAIQERVAKQDGPDAEYILREAAGAAAILSVIHPDAREEAQFIQTLSSEGLRIAEAMEAADAGEIGTLALTGSYVQAAMVLVNSFSGAPSSEEMMLDFLQAIAQAIAELRAEMHERFDRLEDKLDDTFDGLVDYLARNGRSLDEIKNRLGLVEGEISALRRDILRVERKVTAFTIAERRLAADLSTANCDLRYLELLPTYGSLQEIYWQCVSRYRFKAVEASRRISLGPQEVLATGGDAASFAHEISLVPTDFGLNLHALYLNSLDGTGAGISIPDAGFAVPSYWAEQVDGLTSWLAEVPNLGMKTPRALVKEIRRVGNELRHHFYSRLTSAQLMAMLRSLDAHRSQLHNVVEAIVRNEDERAGASALVSGDLLESLPASVLQIGPCSGRSAPITLDDSLRELWPKSLIAAQLLGLGANEACYSATWGNGEAIKGPRMTRKRRGDRLHETYYTDSFDALVVSIHFRFRPFGINRFVEVFRRTARAQGDYKKAHRIKRIGKSNGEVWALRTKGGGTTTAATYVPRSITEGDLYGQLRTAGRDTWAPGGKEYLRQLEGQIDDRTRRRQSDLVGALNLALQDEPTSVLGAEGLRVRELARLLRGEYALIARHLAYGLGEKGESCLAILALDPRRLRVTDLEPAPEASQRSALRSWEPPRATPALHRLGERPWDEAMAAAREEAESRCHFAQGVVPAEVESAMDRLATLEEDRAKWMTGGRPSEKVGLLQRLWRRLSTR